MIGRFILGFSAVGSLVIGSFCDVLFRGGTFRCETFYVCIDGTLFLPPDLQLLRAIFIIYICYNLSTHINSS
jgi:hypothetical protein